MLAEKIQEYFLQHRLTLACAESCTGGGVGAMLVQIPDASGYFLGSVVTYANEAKRSLLHVQAKQVVSETCALEMAQGAKRLFSSDVAVATTGVAGPGGEPVGKVCMAIALPDQAIAWTEHFQGDRAAVIAQTIETVLERLYALCTA